MRSHTAFTLALCLSLIAVAGTASADIIIDENFDAPTRIMIPMAPNEVLITAATMNMWFGGAPSFSMAWGTAVHMSMMTITGLNFSGPIAGSQFGTAPMDAMGFMGWASALTYFAAQPLAGWGVEDLTLSFDYQFTAFGKQSVRCPKGS